MPWDGRATGELAKLLPDPLDDLLRPRRDEPVTVGRLAELDGRVWLLGVAAALMMLLRGGADGGADAGRERARGVRAGGGTGFAVRRCRGRCALRLGVATAVALPLLVWLTDVSADASLSVLGFDAFGAGIELHGHLGMALLLGAVWGAGAGAVGALLACATRGGRAAGSALARGDAGGGGAAVAGHGDGAAGPYAPGAPYRPPNPDTNPYLRVPDAPAENRRTRGRRRRAAAGEARWPPGDRAGVCLATQRSDRRGRLQPGRRRVRRARPWRGRSGRLQRGPASRPDRGAPTGRRPRPDDGPPPPPPPRAA